MAKGCNIVHQYFSRAWEGTRILVKVNPLTFTGVELTVMPGAETSVRELEFDEAIFDDLKADGFQESSALEFNLYLHGLA